MRTVGMVWRKTNPLAPQLTEIASAFRDAVRSGVPDEAGHSLPAAAPQP